MKRKKIRVLSEFPYYNHMRARTVPIPGLFHPLKAFGLSRSVFEPVSRVRFTDRFMDNPKWVSVPFRTNGPESVYEPENLNNVGKFLESKFPGGEILMWKDNAQSAAHLHILFKEATPERRYAVAMTAGMSDYIMNTPDEVPDDLRDFVSRTEIAVFLPPEWRLDDTVLDNRAFSWPFMMMRILAKYPRATDDFIGHGFDMRITDDFKPFANNTKLSSMMLMSPDFEELMGLQNVDGKPMCVYVGIPIYKEECLFKRSTVNGANTLLEKIFGSEDGRPEDYIINIDRPNSCEGYIPDSEQ